MHHRPLLLLTVLTLLVAWPVGAAAHEKEGAYSSAFASYFGDGDPVGLLGADGLAAPQPLEGTGENMRIVANVPLEGTVAGSDIELAGDYAYVGSYGEGVVIIDISDPLNPKRAGVFSCPEGGQFDVQLQPGSNPQYLVMAIESTRNTCHPDNEGFVLVDISDKANPKEVAFVGQAPEEGGLEDGSHNTTMDWPYLYNDQYQPTHGPGTGQVDIFDLRKLIANPDDREPIAVLPTPGGGSHDMQIDHRPDGKVIAYAASIGFTDTFDVSDPTKPKLLQRLRAAEHGVGISHGLEPNHNRTLAIESDEYGGGSGVGACGGGAGRVPPSTSIDVASPGALHFLDLNKDGAAAGQIKTLAGGQVAEQRPAFNIPFQNNPSENEGCTAHVFWQAPDENRLVVAWYGRGTRIVDFSAIEKGGVPKELGFFIPKNTETWSAKPHKGYIFTGDTVRGMDVLEYTGEDCARWPTTSGAAEVQRDRYQGSAAKTPVSEGGIPPTDAIKSTPAGCGGKPKQQPPTAEECRDDDPSPTLPDGGGTGGSSCPAGEQGGGQPNQQGQQQSQQSQQPAPPPATACISSLGIASASARGGGGDGSVDFSFRRRVDRPVTVDIFRQSRGRKITGEQRVRRFTGMTGDFTWNGRDSRGRKVASGVYFARLRVTGPNGRRDTVRLTLGKSKGRFGSRRGFYRRDSCGALGKFKLSRPVFGGQDGRALGIAYRLNAAGRVAVTVTNRRGRVVRRFAARDVAAGRTQRLSLRARGLERGDYRVRLSVTAGGRTTASTLTATKL